MPGRAALPDIKNMIPINASAETTTNPKKLMTDLSPPPEAPVIWTAAVRQRIREIGSSERHIKGMMMAQPR